MNEEKLNIIIANNVKKFRKKQKLSKLKLSYFTDIPIKTITNIEENKENINITTLYKISKVLKTPINNFFKENND
mgnify:CR=1 FL=1